MHVEAPYLVEFHHSQCDARIQLFFVCFPTTQIVVVHFVSIDHKFV